MMLLVWLIGFFAFPNFSEPKDIKIDFISVGLSLLGSGLTLASLTFFQTSALQAWIMLVLGLAILFIFVKRQLRLKQPMLKSSTRQKSFI